MAAQVAQQNMNDNRIWMVFGTPQKVVFLLSDIGNLKTTQTQVTYSLICVSIQLVVP